MKTRTLDEPGRGLDEDTRPERLFPGHSEMAGRMRELDWLATDLGPPDAWPETLRVALSLCLTSRFPTQIWWGPSLTFLYNDATIPFLAASSHAAALGRPGREAWAEMRDALEPLFDRVLATGEASWSEDLWLELDRRVPREEVHVTFSLGPILGRTGRLEGLFGTCTETSEKVIGARRLETLHRLGIKPAEGRTVGNACAEAALVLAGNADDVPFAALYVVDDTRTRLDLRASARTSDVHGLPAAVPLSGDESPWPLTAVLRTQRPREIDLRADGERALILPIPGSLQGTPAGLLVAGVSPRHALDTSYRQFFDAVAAQIGAAISDALAYEAERTKGQAVDEAARPSEERYRALLNSISEGFALIEPVPDAEQPAVDFRFVEVNPAFELQSGLSDVIGRTVLGLTPPVDPFWIEKLAHVMRTGLPTRFQHRVAAADRWFEVMAWRVEPEGTCLAVLFREITEHRRSLRTAAELSRRLQTLVDNTPLAVIEWDADFVVTRWSGHAERIFGWTAAEVVGQRIDRLPLVYAPDMPKVRATVKRLLDPANSFVVSRNRNTTKDGAVLYCEWYNSVLHDEETGRMMAILSLVLDVSERERTEAALRESEARLAGQKEAFQLAVNGEPIDASLSVLLRMAVEQAGDHARAAFFIVEDGVRLRPVPGAANMPESYIRAVDGFEIGPDLPACGAAAYYGRPIITRDVNEDPVWEPWRHVARDHDFRACWSFPIQTLAGRVLGTFAVYFKDPRDTTSRELDLAGTVTQAAAIIMSRQREAEERRTAEEALRDADRRKDEFLATLAHELRNPLAPIRNAVDVMRLAGDGASVAIQARKTIERQLTQLIRLVDDLLDVSRITRNKIDLHQERVLLSSLVHSAIETSRPLIEASGHALTVTLPSQPVWLDADPTRIAQVLANLLNNAAKYTPEHGHIWLTVERDGDEAIVRVRDSGIGIPEEMLPHVFGMFTQVDTSRRHSQGGLGLGLTIVKRLVEMHGGSVTAASEGSGRGSEFNVRLPIRPEEQPGRLLETERAAPAKLPGQRVLVVDDNRDAASTLGLLLEMMGNTVRIAHDGPTALEEARTFRPTLTLLDIGMPGMNGYEVARRLREQSALRDMVLVAVTGWGQEEDRRRSREAGFDHHLTKPPELSSLEKLLASLPASG